MLENVFVLLVSNLVEIIHVELANKRREISMSKVDRKDLLLETINIKDSEVGSLLIPDDDIRVEIVLEDFESLGDENGGACHFLATPSSSAKILFPFIVGESVVTFFLLLTHF